MKISNNDLEKFSKQIILKNVGISGQKKIFNSKVAIIGIGGLGCPLVLYLANSGVGNIGLIDNDKIDLSNLNRQILFTNKDIGKYKAQKAKQVINKINKKIKKILLERITVQIREFPGYAKIRRVALALEPWTVENGMLTPTLKLKRTKVLDHYQTAVNKLYEGH